MKKIRTHYDNLKVSRDAPQEVIRAAYKSLAQKYHPDKSSSSAESEKILTIINKAYEILSSPESRKEHDLWILAQESEAPSESPEELNEKSTIVTENKSDINIKDNWIWYLFGILIIIILVDEYNFQFNNNPSIDSNKYPYQDTAEKYIRPTLAPNGINWPKEASYLDGYPVLRSGGPSNIFIVNGASSDIYLQLASDVEVDKLTIRHIFLPKNSKFNISEIHQGSYEIEFMNLDTGNILKANEIKLGDFGTMELHIYNDANGNLNYTQEF